MKVFPCVKIPDGSCFHLVLFLYLVTVKFVKVSCQTEDISTSIPNVTAPTTTTSTTTEIPKPLPEKCFYRSSTECPTDPTCPCKSLTLADSVAIFCCNITSHEALEQGLECANFSSNVSHIHIRNATLDYLNTTEVKWRMLKSLSVTDGRINKVKGQFLMMTPMLCLNLSNNALLEMENKSLIRLAQLSKLDLSYNNLTHLPALNFMNGRELWMDISGVDTLLCHDIHQFINKTGENQVEFNRENETVCTISKNIGWFPSTDRVALEQIKYINTLQSECPKGDTWECSCRIDRIDYVRGQPPTQSVVVDCSNLHLTRLPEKLPRYTKNLNVSHNNITSIDELSTNPTYEGLRVFVADYNNISSINNLEGSKFLDNYSLFSLRYNKMKSLPTYILANSNDKGFSLENEGLKFGGNELYCDCNTAKFLKAWLQTKIVDYKEILCENVKEKVVDLEPSKMCVHPGDWTDYIYYIIALELFLLIGLIAKVTYDYWVFKTAGYLPWPANKMPKLPCDWLCET